MAKTTDFTKIKFSDLPAAQQEVIISALEGAIGITPARAAEFLALSRTEHPEEDAAWHREDSVGKFKHFLRTEHHWGGAVDAAWGNLEPYAAAVVDAVIAAGA